MVQSLAILQFLATKYGFMPKDPFVAYECANICFALEDILSHMVQFAYSKFMTDDEKAAKKKDFVENVVPIYLKRFEERLKANKDKKYIVGDNITYTDFAMLGFARMAFFNKEQALMWEGILKECPLFNTYLSDIVKMV